MVACIISHLACDGRRPPLGLHVALVLLRVLYQIYDFDTIRGPRYSGMVR